MSTDHDKYPIENPDKSLGDLVGELTGEIATLVSGHIDLAKAELKQDVKDASKAGTLFGVAGVAALLALIALSMAAGWALAEEMAPGWAFLIVSAVWAIVAAGLVLSGKKQVEQMDPGPHETITEIKEDKEWLKTQTS